MIQIAKASALPMCNILINGDFQINQRAKASYSSYGYTVDMWRIDQNSAIDVDDGGIHFYAISNTAYIIQDISGRNDLVGKKCTLAVNVNGSVFSFSEVVQEATEATFKQVGDTGLNYAFYFNSDDNKFRVSLSTQNGSGEKVNVRYIDLFEGGLAYHHIKEEYATALMRCQLYYRRLSVNAYGYVLSNSFNIVQQIGSIMPMIEKPTITEISEGQRFNLANVSYAYGATGCVYVSMQAVEAQSAVRILNGVIELSCEPL